MGAGEIVTMIIGFSGAVAGFYSVIASAKKSDVDTLSTIIDRLKEELDRRDQVIADLEKKLDDVQCWADDLVKQVVSLGGTPVQMRSKKDDE